MSGLFSDFPFIINTLKTSYLQMAYFDLALDKSLSLIFIRKRYLNAPPITLDGKVHPIAASNMVKYLGLIVH